MAEKQEQVGEKRGVPWRLIGWGIAAFLLLLPLVTNAPWTLSDYIFAGVIFGIVGGLYELTVWASSNYAYRAAVAVALAAGLLMTWINLAVGIIGNENNPANLMFFAVIALAVVGTLVLGPKARRMAMVMIATAVAQAATAVAALIMAHFTFVLAGFFMAMWLLSARLFLMAARDTAESAAA